MSINRFELVSRHSPIFTRINKYTPLSIGNGELCFTADITGMQTIPKEYKDGIPLCTQSQWGWHSFPQAKDASINKLNKKLYEVNGRKVGYASCGAGQEELFNQLRQNPHRLNLARIALALNNGKNKGIKDADIQNPRQILNLWEGCIASSFFIDNKPVKTYACCHPKRDLLAFKIESQLLAQGLGVEFSFPYPSPDKNASDWTKNNENRIYTVSEGNNYIQISHIIDSQTYYMTVTYPEGSLVLKEQSNLIKIIPASYAAELKFTCEFSNTQSLVTAPTFEQTAECCREHWKNFWESGGCIDFSKCTDSRASELERRVILSQYLLAVQCAGSLPPQETGLTFNSWYGKFHLEMHWWHGVHFILWNRSCLFEKSLWWYESILPLAKELAASQGYDGARWPKMTSCDGLDSPSPIGPFLIWQQPHPIYYAELLYRTNPCIDILDKYSKIVFESAEFMASYVAFDSKNSRYVLGPGVIPMGENHLPENTVNPVFELEYWNFGLKTAIEWKKRMNLDPIPEWEKVRTGLSDLPHLNGVYLAHENCPDTYASFNTDHPAMLGALGILPGEKSDKKIMLNTLNAVLKHWNMYELWGWDFPMMAMTAARLGLPDTAVDLLLLNSPKNEYLPNGHNKQADRTDLPIYLPGNGALLTALALMTAGYEGCAENFSGFPKDGNWNVEWEEINKII